MKRPGSAKVRVQRQRPEVKDVRDADREALAFLGSQAILIPCFSGSKIPALLWGKRTGESYDFETIVAVAPYQANWALLPGADPLGLVVVDCDSREARRAFLDRFGDLPTPLHTTRRGLHALFRWPSELPLPARRSFRIKRALLPDTELLTGKPALIPPSVVEGKRYRWLTDPRRAWPPAELPTKLLRAAYVRTKGGYRGLLELLEAGEAVERPRSQAGTERAPIPATDKRCVIKGEAPNATQAFEPVGRLGQAHGLPLSLALAGSEKLVAFACKKAGVAFRGEGKPCRCFLHPPDRHPSAGWILSNEGTWLFHCFHDDQSFSLAEVYAFLATGTLAKLGPGEALGWLFAAAHEAGLLDEELEAIEREHLEALSLIGWPKLSDMWRLLWGHACGQALRDSTAFLAPVRHCGGALELPKGDACRLINLLCALGFFRKVGFSERGAQRLEPCHVDPQEVKRLWDRLALTDLKRFSRRYVEARLGPEIAAAVFRREFESSQSPEGKDEL